MKTLITGVSGVGKTTVGRRLRKLGYSVIDIDEDGFCHWKNKETGGRVDYEAVLDKEFIDAHVWVCDTGRVITTCSKEAQTYIVGMPENIDELIGQVDKIILLKCLPKTFIDRILKRTDNDFGKEASAQKEILGMYEKFNKRIVEAGATVVGTEEDVDSVIQKIIRMIN